MTQGWTRRDVLRCVGVNAGALTLGLVSLGLAPRRARAADLRLGGRWALVDASRARARVLAGIEAAVEDMNFTIRGLARRRLRETVLPPAWMNLEITAEDVQMSGPGRTPLVVPTDARPRPMRGSGGEKVEVSAWWSGETLVRRFQGRGRREDRLSLRDMRAEKGESRLVMRSVISASLMPTPVRFTLQFRPG